MSVTFVTEYSAAETETGKKQERIAANIVNTVNFF